VKRKTLYNALRIVLSVMRRMWDHEMIAIAFLRLNIQ